MQDMPQGQDAGFVVEWQLASDVPGGESHRLIDLSGEASRPEVVVIREDSPLETSSGR